jgi:hypothetical protein
MPPRSDSPANTFNPSAYIRRRSKAFGLDPLAVLSVAAGEGLSGRPGDQNTSFGPFQLHYGGAYPSFAPRGSPQQSQAWAMSPAGIDYALKQISGVAGGMRGANAISQIISRFERPANIPASIAAALKRYGPYAGEMPSETAGSLRSQGTMPMGNSLGGDPHRRRNFAMAMINATQPGQQSLEGMLGALMQLRASRPAPMSMASYSGPTGPTSTPPGPVGPVPAGGGGGRLNELFYDPLGGIKYGKQIGAIGGHSDHVHISTPTPQQMIAAIRQAQAMGLHVGENTFVGDNPERGIHVPTSFHYQTYPGSKVSEAADISGSPKAMAAFYKWALRRFNNA